MIVESEDIGARISDLRKQSKMSQDQVAEQLHVTRQAISNWERNRTQPDLWMIRKMSTMFGVNIEEMIRGGYGKLMNTNGIQIDDNHLPSNEYNYEYKYNKYEMAIGLFYAVCLFVSIAIFVLIALMLRDSIHDLYSIGLLAIGWLCTFLAMGLLSHATITLLRKDK